MKTILMILALAASFMPGRKNEGYKIDPTINYHWFDTCGNYLRQNLLDDETWVTGYNNNPGNPKTLQELGYDPANCIAGSPPIPNDPDFPDQRLYSHP